MPTPPRKHHDEPRQMHDNLPEFDEFLTQIGYGHLYRHCPDSRAQESDSNTPATGAPAATETAKPARPHPQARTTWLRWLWATLLVPAVASSLLMLGIVTWAPLQSTLSRMAGRSADPSDRYVTAPFFAPEDFERLREGMTPDQVRNLIGIPLTRRVNSTAPNREEWIYSAPADEHAGAFPLFIVTMKGERLLRAKGVTVRAQALAGPWPQIPSLDMGRWVLRLASGDRVEMDSSAETALLVGPSCPSDLKMRAQEHLLTYRYERAISYPRNGASLPAVALHHGGILYGLPYVPHGASTEALEADLNWLLERLGVQ